mmetsp:Transcript_25372/g.74040  ORF Transcript_25372/g.74040 Transcript_25372/m.74040 type:complete len:82 (+) Transcript_25372:48-293(+)
MVFHAVPSVPELAIGDWLFFPNTGAYTAAGATDFNGIPSTDHAGIRRFYVESKTSVPVPEDHGLPVIFSPVPPMEVRRLFS